MKKILLSIITIALLFIACEEKSIKDSKSEIVEKSEEFGNELFFISKPWMRPGATNRNTAAFMHITNNTDADDTLFSVQSDLAKVVELHETYEKGNDMMGMRHVDFIVIPSKSTVELKPGSFHVMLIGLNKDLLQGNKGTLIANFKKSGKIELPIMVESLAK